MSGFCVIKISELYRAEVSLIYELSYAVKNDDEWLHDSRTQERKNAMTSAASSVNLTVSWRSRL